LARVKTFLLPQEALLAIPAKILIFYWRTGEFMGFWFDSFIDRGFSALKMVPYGTIFSCLWYRMVPFFYKKRMF